MKKNAYEPAPFPGTDVNKLTSDQIRNDPFNDNYQVNNMNLNNNFVPNNIMYQHQYNTSPLPNYPYQIPNNYPQPGINNNFPNNINYNSENQQYRPNSMQCKSK